MPSLQWSISHAVFVTEIDDEHKQIFAAVAALHKVLPGQSRELTERLIRCLGDHFAHEERLMRAARYSSLRWHKRQHDHARRQVEQFVLRMEEGDSQAGPALVEYLTLWLANHTGLADRMMGAFLRNRRRVGKLTLRAGTKPMAACAWVDSHGDRFNPAAGTSEA